MTDLDFASSPLNKTGISQSAQEVSLAKKLHCLQIQQRIRIPEAVMDFVKAFLSIIKSVSSSSSTLQVHNDSI